MPEKGATDGWERLLTLNADEIDYSSLPEAVLEKLALAEEPFIATLAVGELVTRRSSRARPVLSELLDTSKSQADRYLQAAALEGLYEIDANAALQHIATHSAQSDPYVLSSMIELIQGNEPDPNAEPARSAIQAVAARLRSRPEESEITAQQRADFLEAYGGSGPNG